MINKPQDNILLFPDQQETPSAPKPTIPSSLDQGEGQLFYSIYDITPKSADIEKHYRDPYINKLTADLKSLASSVKVAAEKPSIIKDKLYGLPSNSYEIINPINVILKIYEDEVIAIIPELELYGEGSNEVEAINELKLELIDLIYDLEETPDNKLGTSPLSWKNALKHMIRKCQ